MYASIIKTLSDNPVREVRIGLHWTAVVVEKSSGLQCGLASTLEPDHHHTGVPIIPEPGQLENLPALELARLDPIRYSPPPKCWLCCH